MGTLKTILNKLAGGSKSLYEYETYKYDEIDSKWIIYQDQLQYLHNKSILGESLFKTIHVVLAQVPIQHLNDIVGLYLYIDDKNTPINFFQINQKTKIIERCRRVITPIPTCFLFELQLNDREESVIFGAKDDQTRKVWISQLKNVLSQSNTKTKDQEPYLTPTPLIESDVKPSVPLTSSIQPWYRPFERVSDNHSRNILLTRDYFSLTSNSHHVDQNAGHLKTESNSEPPGILWNEIFYSNDKDDYIDVLTRTGQSGVFLIRPQSKKIRSNDHDYTLCLYHKLLGIRSFPIYEIKSREAEYSLARKGRETFADMLQLCQYYMRNPLPMLTKDIFLTKPYKHCEHRH
ncbi:unnamed protein product [Adineta ricciae]|uniref:SH2 domain-containing protein n=1 Tax=Adineta ricciae TaxID=249248 RepID=A0A815ZF85_ADIRI|nr:unnamed protein product [Adineta ricciae]